MPDNTLMNNRATKKDVANLVDRARKYGWTVEEEREDFSHIIQLKSPIGALGDWAIITIHGLARRFPCVSTIFHYTKGRKPARGLWHAQYALREDQQYVYQKSCINSCDCPSCLDNSLF